MHFILAYVSFFCVHTNITTENLTIEGFGYKKLKFKNYYKKIRIAQKKIVERVNKL